MVDQTGLRLPHSEGLAECFESQLPMQAIADGPPYDAAGKQVDDDGQIQPALPGPYVADIGAPLLIGALGREVLAEQVRRDRQAVMTVGGALETALLPGLQAVLAHQPGCPPPTDG